MTWNLSNGKKNFFFFIVMKCIELICQPVTGDAADSVSVKNDNAACPHTGTNRKWK